MAAADGPHAMHGNAKDWSGRSPQRPGNSLGAAGSGTSLSRDNVIHPFRTGVALAVSTAVILSDWRPPTY